MDTSITMPNDTKKVFLKKGTCSKTFFYLLNRQFGYLKANEESAADPLAGGLMKTGHQCGMLWGASLAVGAEAYRRYKNSDLAIPVAITATQHVMESFAQVAKSHNCREITDCDFTQKFGLLKYMLKTMLHLFTKSVCFNLAEKWAPAAIQAATEGLSQIKNDWPHSPISCSSEVAKKMGATDEEMVMVAGFAGGMGLSGNACGALAAALWMNNLNWCKKHPGKTPPYFNNPTNQRIIDTFYNVTGAEILCLKITGQFFNTINDHTEFIKSGGCAKLMAILAKA